MGIDLVVTSLSDEWAQYADSAVALRASLERLVPFGMPGLPDDRGFAQRAWLEASPEEERAGAARVAEAVRSFQRSLSSRFAVEISWTDPVGMEEIFRQVDPYASVELHRIVGLLGSERFPNLAVLDIANVYVPADVPGVLVGQPLPVGSSVAMARELAEIAARIGYEQGMSEHLSMLERACRASIEHGAVILVSG